MKRKGNLYVEMCKVENIIEAFDEVCRNTKNKRAVEKYKACKCIIVKRIYDVLINRNYVVGPYNRFVIYEPKKRNIISQNIFDKIINHLVARIILIPTIGKCLIDANVASRKGFGTHAGIKYFKKCNELYDRKFGTYYILKCDIKSFFANINHDILKEKLKRRIKDKEALKIVFDIIDSEDKGLGIGNMTSQILAIYYLDDMDKYIKEVLKIKHYVRYQDDFLLWHQSKEYLRYCLLKIKEFLISEKLELNYKTRIYSCKENFIFLGRSKECKYARRREITRKLKKRIYMFNSGKISLDSLIASIKNYRHLLKYEV